MVFLARHNFLKTFYGFFEVDLARSAPFTTIERLASWASRYVSVAPVMKPHVGGFYRLLAGVKNKRILLTLSEEVIRDIILWRTFLAVAWFQPSKFARPFESFRAGEPDIKITFDASLKGLGFFIEKREKGLNWVPWSAMRLYPLPFILEASEFQNVAEFMSLTIALVVIARAGLRHKRISLVGDSLTALSWAGGKTPRGSRVTRAATVFTCLGLHFSNNVEVTNHICGGDNDIADALSRNYTTSDKGTIVEEHLKSLGFTFLDITMAYDKIVKLCDPTLPLDSIEEYAELWAMVLKWCTSRKSVD
jgi:hypothetical protein